MTTDLYTKVVLGVVAVCLALLVVQGFGATSWQGCPMASEAMGAPGQLANQERFRILPVAMGRVAFRIDTQTGATWRMAFPGGTAWTPVGEASEAASELEQGEGAPSLLQKAPAPVQKAPVRLQKAPALAPKAPAPLQKAPAPPEGAGS